MGLDPFEEAGSAVGVAAGCTHRLPQLYRLPTDATNLFFRFIAHFRIVLTAPIFNIWFQFLPYKWVVALISIGPIDPRGDEGRVGGDCGGDGGVGGASGGC